MKVVVAGGGGFLGRALVEELSLFATEVVVLSRSNEAVPRARTVDWDGVTLGKWVDELHGATAVVNYAGSPILARWTRGNKKRILNSRVQSTQIIGEAIAATSRPPKVWINGSATGFYGDRGRHELPESEEPGTGFLADVCQAWEAATAVAPTPNTRLVLLRTGLVLDGTHPPLSLLARLVRLYLGGAIGDGRAYMPWIHVSDHARLVRFCIERNIEGPVNAVAPNPVTNGELMGLLRREFQRPRSPAVPKTVIRALGWVGFPSEAVLNSTRAVPIAAEEAGFRWLCPKPDSAVSNLTRRWQH